MILKEEQIIAFREVIGDFLRKSGAILGALVDEGGRLIVHVTREAFPNEKIMSFSVLVTGSFLAARELMKELGGEIDSFSLEGEGYAIYMKEIKGLVFFAILSGEYHLSVVKIYVNQLAKRMESVIEGIEDFKPNIVSPPSTIFLETSKVSIDSNKTYNQPSDKFVELKELLLGYLKGREDGV